MKSWIVLKASWTGKEWRFQEQGPFRQEEVLTKLYSGELDFQDFAWHEGMSNWARISELRSFGVPRPQSWNSESPNENPSKLVPHSSGDRMAAEKNPLRPTRAQLFGWDKNLRPQQGVHSDAAPTETDGVDLVSYGGSLPTL